MDIEVIQALKDIEKTRGISKEVLIDALESALVSAFKKNFGSSQNVEIKIDPDTGTIKVYAKKKVVEDVEDSKSEISLEEAKAINPNYSVGDIVDIEVTPRNFGRIAAQTAKQIILQRIREAERANIYEEFSNREGDIVTGVVQRKDHNNIFIDLGRVEALLPYPEQIPKETYNQGDRIKVYIVEVKNTTKGPQVIVSRTHPGLLKRLLELEVPEIYDGIVEIKAIAREAGTRSKIAVASKDPNVDSVGACVGPKGMRIQAIVQELNGEKIDIIEWSDDYAVFVANSLSPSKVLAVSTNEEYKIARVIVPDSHLSLAIGKEGQNARLAAKITGWKIDIKSESQYLAMVEALQQEELDAEHAEDAEFVETGEDGAVFEPGSDEDFDAGAEADVHADSDYDEAGADGEDAADDAVDEAADEGTDDDTDTDGNN